MNKTLVNSMYRRRMSSSEVVQQLWDAVKVIRYQRQVPNAERIVKFMSRIYSVNEEDVTKQLGHCVRDGLLVVIKRKGSKGSKVGVEQEGYKLPEGPAERDKHDWYCSHCHLNGDVIPCGDCHRVFHVYCISNPQSSTKNKYQCMICLGIEEDTYLQDIRQNVLNKLLVMVCSVLRDRYGALLKSSKTLSRSVQIGTPGAQLNISTDAEAWRIPYFIHKVSDIAKMIHNAKQSVYTNLSQFEADCQTIVHNVVIFHGLHSNLADLARQMARDCRTELEQIRWCHTCYLATGGGKNVRRRKFYKPCHPPHELVYARETKTSPFWPAKVIHEDNDKLDIRFFGGTHFRMRVDRSHTVPITTNITSMQDFKRTSNWNRACDEVAKLRSLVRKLEEGSYQSSSSSSDSDESIKSEKSLKSEKSSRSSRPMMLESIPQMKSLPPPKPRKRAAKPPPPPKPPKPAKKPQKPKKPSARRRKASIEEDIPSDDDSDFSYVERGRRKAVIVLSDEPPPPPEVTIAKRKRGRPPLNSKTLPAAPPPPKRKRGRPPKKKVEPPPVEKDDGKEELRSAVVPYERPSRCLPKRKSSEGMSYTTVERRKPIPLLPPPPIQHSDDDDDTKLEVDREEGGGSSSNRDSADRTAPPPSPLSNTLSPAKSPRCFKNEEEIVSSSCMEPHVRSFGTQTKRTAIDDIRKDKANKELIAKLTVELEELKTSSAEELKQLREAHLLEIATAKKKQWCYNCELEAIYHCCWNTAYCSTECQQLHWQREHKRVCRRKR